MWFWFALIALLCWSGSDLFSKIGCCGQEDRTAHLKMVVAVGTVMGLHAAYMILFRNVAISWQVIWTYLPVSLLYIGSMTLGYVGLRYIELSISSPICNASGALVAIIAIVSGTAEKMAAAQYIAIFLACAGVIGLGFVEANEDDELRAARQEASNYKYAKSWLALALPIAYCILDAAGTFADDLVLETLNEDSANVAYELTFLVAGIVSFIYTVVIKKQKLLPKAEGPKYVGAAFETAGQLAYIYALASGESALAAPIIASYCMVSVLWSRLFLKEKLSWKHYTCILVTFAGILIMGIYDM